MSGLAAAVEGRLAPARVEGDADGRARPRRPLTRAPLGGSIAGRGTNYYLLGAHYLLGSFDAEAASVSVSQWPGEAEAEEGWTRRGISNDRNMSIKSLLCSLRSSTTESNCTDSTRQLGESLSSLTCLEESLRSMKSTEGSLRSLTDTASLKNLGESLASAKYLEEGLNSMKYLEEGFRSMKSSDKADDGRASHCLERLTKRTSLDADCRERMRRPSFEALMVDNSELLERSFSELDRLESNFSTRQMSSSNWFESRMQAKLLQRASSTREMGSDYASCEEGPKRKTSESACQTSVDDALHQELGASKPVEYPELPRARARFEERLKRKMRESAGAASLVPPRSDSSEPPSNGGALHRERQTLAGSRRLKSERKARGWETPQVEGEEHRAPNESSPKNEFFEGVPHRKMSAGLAGHQKPTAKESIKVGPKETESEYAAVAPERNIDNSTQAQNKLTAKEVEEHAEKKMSQSGNAVRVDLHRQATTDELERKIRAREALERRMMRKSAPEWFPPEKLTFEGILERKMSRYSNEDAPPPLPPSATEENNDSSARSRKKLTAKEFEERLKKKMSEHQSRKKLTAKEFEERLKKKMSEHESRKKLTAKEFEERLKKKMSEHESRKNLTAIEFEERRKKKMSEGSAGRVGESSPRERRKKGQGPRRCTVPADDESETLKCRRLGSSCSDRGDRSRTAADHTQFRR